MQFDLMVVDFHLYAIDGFELCDDCSRLNIDTPILAVASEDDQKLLTHLKRKGFDEILIIPFGLNDIYAKILGLLTSNRIPNKQHFKE
jgi:DNA-binding response OmpR family regulator